ncbi:MAG: SCO family protein [Planctomycetota bacterium]
MSDTPTNESIANEPLPADPHATPGRGFWILMALTLIGVGGVAYVQYSRVDQARTHGGMGTPSSLPIVAELPEFTLTERSGKTVTLNDLRGKVWVADFIFTGCAGPCPVMSKRMRTLQGELLRDRKDAVLCVSISVDPENDTPAVLREYAETRGADPKRWLFLTGEKKPVRSLVSEGFKLTVPRSPEEEEELLHSTRFALVDRRGRVRGYYYCISPEDEEDMVGAMDREMAPDEKRRMMHDIESLIREGNR